MANVSVGYCFNENSATLTGQHDLTTCYEEVARSLDQSEQCWQRKHELDNRLRRLKAFIQNLQQQQQQNHVAPPELAQYSHLFKDSYQKFVQASHEITALEQAAIKGIENYIGACEVAGETALGNLQQWKWQQKAAQYGKLLQNDLLHSVTKRYQNVMEHAFGAWRMLCRFHALHVQSVQGQASTVDNILQSIRHRLATLFERILQNSFEVTFQPPMVVKNKIRLEATLLAAIDKLGLETQPVQMSAKIISEETAAELITSPEQISQKISTVGHIDNANTKTRPLQRLSANTLGFELKNIKVTVESRKQATKSGEAIMKKYYFLCTAEIPFDNQVFKLRTLSLPFMVSVHGTQDVELYARAWWDMAFSNSVDSIPLTGEPEVRWHVMGPALEAVFSLLTKGTRRLTPNDVEYLKYRLFNGVPPESDPVISWNQLYKEKLERICGAANEIRRKCTFSFWEWLFRIGDMIQEKSGRDTGVFEMWEERYVEGFISKQEAELRLLQAPEPMMLIRFSDNQLAGLSIVCRSPYTNEIDHLIPFKFKEEIEKLTLPVMLVNCEQVKDIGVIYPDKSREKIEKMAAANKRMAEDTEMFGYRTRTLVIQSGEKCGDGRSQMYSPSPSLGIPSTEKCGGITMRYSTSPSQIFSPCNISQATPAPAMIFPQHGFLTRASENYGAFPEFGSPNEFDLPDELMQIQSQREQFEELDDQTMQNILSNLRNSNDEDEMDAIVRMVQTFSPANQSIGNQARVANRTDSTNMSFDFDML